MEETMTTTSSEAEVMKEGETAALCKPLQFHQRDMAGQQRFYLTTAINYMNGRPHIGHAYEIVLADFISRYQRVVGRNVYFMTGSDEHGQKMAATAVAEKLSPKELCDRNVEVFKEMNRLLISSEDKYIRTTDPHHHEVCEWMWNRALEAGDIYLGTYHGWYNVKEETFVTRANAEADGYKDPSSGQPYVMYDEETYFFRLSKYHDFILDLLKNTDFVVPQIRRAELVARLESQPLEDLCVSRSTFDWGVKVPNTDNKHVMYVWFDALTNYVSGVNGHDKTHPMAHLWPADCHLIGKDIQWFHCVIWPAMLKSVGLEIPHHVGGHGFVQAADGAKMSKSVGNVVDPFEVAKQYGPEAFRYYLIRESRFGYDLKFSTDSLIDMHNADLADVLGNLVHRVITLCVKNCDAKIPDVSLAGETPPFDFSKLFDACETAMKAFDVHTVAELAISAVKDINKYLTAVAPWSIKNDPIKQQRAIRMVLEALYVAIHFLHPLLPMTAEEICKRLNTPMTTLSKLNNEMTNLKSGVSISSGPILFKKFDK